MLAMKLLVGPDRPDNGGNRLDLPPARHSRLKNSGPPGFDENREDLHTADHVVYRVVLADLWVYLSVSIHPARSGRERLS